MMHGNWLLTGWQLTDVSFYTTELPEYILVELLRGLGPADVHVSAAITYTLLVLLAGLLAKGSKTGREGLVRVLIASGIMIAPQVGPGAFLLLLSPDHTGTGVPLLLVFLVLDRAPRRPWVPPLVGLMLVWVEVGDEVAITIAAAPIAWCAWSARTVASCCGASRGAARVRARAGGRRDRLGRRDRPGGEGDPAPRWVHRPR